MAKKEIELNFWHHVVIKFLQRDREIADAIIQAAFEGHHIAKFRSDRGKPKKGKGEGNESS